MDRTANQVIERLGPAGLARALDDLFDPTQLVRLANTCGLKYPGMRTQTQTRQRLVKDIVDKATQQTATRRAVVRALQKETAEAVRLWLEAPIEEKVRRLTDDAFLRTDNNLGLHLYLLASQPAAVDLGGYADRFAHHWLSGIVASSGGAAGDPGKADSEQTRLQRQVTARDKKVRHLEAQLTKSREAQKTAKRDLIQRKGELAESRMLAERLRQELAAAKTAVQVASASPDTSADKAIGELAKTVRRLAAEQRELAHALGKRSESKSAPAAVGREALAPLLLTLDGLKEEIRSSEQSRAAETARQSRALDEIQAALKSTLSTETTRARKPRRRASSGRVGVFIDVQNVYYGARRLKGKLDFDSLLAAAVADRRLIKALAYVVESKETDQSQFIAMLEKRAIEVRRKALQVRSDGSMKGDWDMELALDILDAAANLDVVVLVSGDGDFTSLVKRVKAIGPRVEVIGFPRHTAKSLIEAADAFQPLDRKFMIYSHGDKSAKPGAASKRPPEARSEPVEDAPAPGTPDSKPSRAATA